MNKTAIKNFAIWARNKLIADIEYRAGLMGITAEGIAKPLPQSTKETEFYDIGTAEPYAVSGEAINQRRNLVEILSRKMSETNYKTAYKYVCEEVAYTWFNRLIAVRFMEVNDYLPSHVRVLSSDSGKMEPDLVTTPFDADLSFTEDEKMQIIQMKQDNQLDEVFRLLFIKQCNALNSILPALFEQTNDYTELLLNISAIDKEGVVYHLINDISEDDFNIEKGGQIEIIGWLYQYYNTEAFAELYEGDRATEKITADDLPSVTQLFTPDWIVRYMVENSLGRLWIEGHNNDLLKNKWKYYLDDTERVSEIQTEIAKYKLTTNPEDIHFIDPCMGSGHILVYAFEVLMQIYESAGYSERDAAKSILENNLYGIDIDDRAYQMAYFAVMMKARQHNRRILSSDTVCHVYSIQESNFINRNQLKYFGLGLNEDEKNDALNQIGGLLDTFMDAKEYGSILDVENYNWDLLHRFVEGIDMEGQMTLDAVGLPQTQERIKTLIEIGKILSNRYEVVVTNPPYMNANRMNTKLSKMVSKKYQASKQDLSMVMFQAIRENISKQGGYISFITPTSWMFSSKFKHIREIIVNELQFESIVDCGTELFDGKIGHLYIGAWTLRNMRPLYRGKYVCLTEYCYSRRNEKQTEFFNKNNRGEFDQRNFDLIEDFPVSYNVSDKIFSLFKEEMRLGDFGDARQGLTTSDNVRFIRSWNEVDYSTVCFDCSSCDDTENNGMKWYPYLKGGDYQKWFPRQEFIVNYFENGKEIKDLVMEKYSYLNNPGFVVKNTEWYFKSGITWNDVGGERFNARLMPNGYIFADASPSFFSSKVDIWTGLAYFNSCVFQEVANVICSGLHYSTGQIPKIPFRHIPEGYTDRIIRNSKKCYELVQEEIVNKETSWSFSRNSLVGELKMGRLIADKYKEWEAECENRFNQLKANEEELNRIFIDIYGLQDELTPEVEDKDVTVRKADLQRDIKSLVSYAVGCMFGRYSVDREGLVYAGGNIQDVFEKRKNEKGYELYYLKGNGGKDTFAVDVDNIIPITDEEYMEDDIVALFVRWVKSVYGADTLEQNLDFIASALGNKGNTSRDIIRNYFINDFFKDHCQTYSVTGSGKRPIYWLFDSGKQNGFKALIYLHRYNADTIGNLRVDYLHRMQRVYESEIGRMQDMMDHSTNSREVGAATKRKEKLQKQLKECRDYDEKIGHLALARTELDLDDGVKVNYRKLQTAADGKFYEVLADSKNIMVKEK